MLRGRLSIPEPNGTRSTAVLIAVAVAVGIWLLTTVVGRTSPALVAGCSGVSVGALTILRDTETPAGLAITALLLPIVGVSVLAAVVLPVRVLVPVPVDAILATIPTAIGLFGLVGAAWLAGFGVLGLFNATVGNGSIAAMWTVNNKAAVGPSVLFAGIIVGRFDALTQVPAVGFDSLGITSVLLAPRTATVAMITFLVLCSFVIAGGQLILAAAPIVQLTPQTSQERVEAGVNQLSRLLNISLWVIVSLTVGGLVAVVSSVDIAAIAGRYPALFALFAAPGLRRVLLVAFGGAMLIAAVFGGVQLLTGRIASTVGWFVPGILAGATTGTLAVVGTPAVSMLQDRVPAAVAPIVEQVTTALTPAGVIAGVIVIGMSLLTFVLGVVIFGSGINYFPVETAGSAMAATGLAIGAIAIGIFGASGLTVFAVVGLSVFVWDIGDRGATTWAELKTESPLQIELIHTLSAAVVTIGGITIAWVLYATVLGGIVPEGGTVVAMLAAILGVVVILAAIQG
ncbi:hypothetical protein [Halonotius sp. GCM10025705]|uniref:hypothetical protein n=1 Tax=Halonotius sp. GCM10025705 TaxID=3252678 RepID=UPI003607954B